MGILTDVIDELEAELHQSAVPSDLSDEQRIFALMAIQARADQGDEAARAKLAAVERLFARAHGSGALETDVSGHVTGCDGPITDQAA